MEISHYNNGIWQMEDGLLNVILSNRLTLLKPNIFHLTSYILPF